MEKDLPTAVKYYSQAAEKGIDAGQLNLGIAYLTGAGVPKDEDEAVKWLRKAAAQGDEDAKKALRGIGKD